MGGTTAHASPFSFDRAAMTTHATHRWLCFVRYNHRAISPHSCAKVWLKPSQANVAPSDAGEKKKKSVAMLVAVRFMFNRRQRA